MPSVIDFFMTENQIENYLEHAGGLGSLTPEDRKELKEMRKKNSKNMGTLGAAAGAYAAGTAGAATGGIIGSLFGPGGTFTGTVLGLHEGVVVGAIGGAAIGSAAGDMYSIAKFALARKYMRAKKELSNNMPDFNAFTQ